jgi:histidine triad (HIT) family protein
MENIREECLFCKIADKKIKAVTLYENDHVLAFLDVMPRAVGHTLVIPKIHVPNILELPDAEIEPMFAAVKHVAGMLSLSLRPDGITIGANQGRASGQEVDHLHVHLMPRWHNDHGHSIQSVVDAPPKEPLEEIAAKIRKARE